MSFESIAALVSGKRPFYLYEFARGPSRWFFTSLNKEWSTVPDMFALSDVFAEPNVFERIWVPSSIKHGRIPHTTRSSRSDFPITLPQSDPFARSFLSPIGLDKTKVIIWKGFENDPDLELAVIYRGQIIQASPSDESRTIDLICGTGLNALDRKALPAVMQRPCRRVVYYQHGKCGLRLSDWQVGMTATVATGLTLTIPDAAGQADGFYTAGIIEFDGAKEMIVSHEGSTIVLLANTLGIAAEIAANGTAAVKLARGCDLSFATCRDAFSNEDNHGGFPHMTDSPFDGRSIS